MKIKFIFVVFLCFYVNMSLSHYEDQELNDNGTLYSNTSNFSLGPSLCYLPFCFYFNDAKLGNDENMFSENTKIFRDFFCGLSIKKDWLIQKSYCARALKFFPNVGINLQFFYLGRYLARSIEYLLFPQKKSITKNKNNPFVLNFYTYLEPETNIFNSFRFCQQIGVGISFLLISRNPIEKIGIKESEVSLCYDNESFSTPIFDVLFMSKCIFKWEINYSTEIHLGFGYSYNPLLFFANNKKKINKIIEPGLFNFFVDLNLNFINNKGGESLNWFNEKKTYKKQKKDIFVTISTPPIFVGKYYEENNNFIVRKYYSSFYLYVSHPFCFSFSEVHYLGFYCDFTLSFPEIKTNSDITVGFNFNSNYKSIRLEHNFGLYVFADGMFFKKKEISKKKNLSSVREKFLSNRFIYRPRLYINFFKIAKLFSNKNKAKLFEKFSIYIGINIMLFTIRNDKTCYILENKKNKLKYTDAQIESYSIGICIKNLF